MNYLWLDAETTGLNPVHNDIIEMAAIPYLHGKEQPIIHEFCQPVNWDGWTQGAEDVHKISRSRAETFQTSGEALDKFIEQLDQYNCKWTIAGYNVDYDKKMMSGWFAKHGKSADFNRLFAVPTHDTYKRWKKYLAKFGNAAPQLENNKLETVAKHYGIEIDAHQAKSDIEATIALDKIIADLLGEDTYEYEPTTNWREVVIGSEFQPLPQLHLHSQYSLGMAVPTPKEWLKFCEEKGITGVSCVDHGSGISLYDAVRISTDKTTYVPGVGLYLRFSENGKAVSMINAWAQSKEGYFNLLKLSSLGFETTEEINGVTTPVLNLQQIVDNSEGLAFGIGGRESIFSQLLLNNQGAAGKILYKQLLEKLGDKLYVEINPIDIVRVFESKVGFTKIPRTTDIEEANLGKAISNFLLDTVNEHGGQIIPVSEAFFFDAGDKILQDTLMKNKHKDNAYFYENYHFKDADVLYKQLKVHLGDKLNEDIFSSWIANAQNIVDRAKGIEITFDYHMPHIDIPENIQQQTDDYDEQTYLYTLQLCKEHGRWSDDPEYIERFEMEMAVIKNNSAMNFLPYFLLYEDLGAEARRQGFLQNIARGSAGGSLISYYLKVIHVDPIKANLPFERFLSHARINAGSWPDIDMDISRGARPFIMKYLKEKYGYGFAQISTLSTMKTKNAIKDTMMALYGRNRKDPEIEQVCKTIPDSPQGVSEEDFLYGYEDKEGNYHQGHLETNEQLQLFFDQYPDVGNIVKRLIGIVRGWSRHASAFIISTVNLSETRCPTMTMWDKHMDDYIQVSQYPANMVEGSGLVKADILGLKTLDMVTDCVDLVMKRAGVDYLEEGAKGVPYLYRLPEDQDVYADFYSKATDSSFQFNTSLIKGYIQEFKPTQRKNLADMTALCRPGALDAEWEPGVSAAQYYLDVRNDKREASFVHDDLKGILGETHGVFVYQEQVMKFLVDFGGHTLEESDQVRGAIAKKKLETMQKSFDRVRQKTSQLGWKPEQTEKVCQQIEAFARYSFNLSHSHAYAELGYITMYLKHHHPLEWWTAVLNNEDDEDKTRHYISILGEIIKPPSMKYPADHFFIADDSIKSPVGVIKSVGDSAVSQLVENGPFENIEQYLKTVNHSKCNIGAVGQMIKARAADDFFDQGLPYPEARLKFMSDFLIARKKIKKTTSKFKDELLNVDPLSIFLMERDVNKSFNKTVLDEPLLKDMIQKKWRSLTPTGKRNMPFQTNDGTIVLSNIKVAQALLKQGMSEDRKFAFILMFEGSRVKKGVSKKGNDYCFTSIELSDGYNTCEAIVWKRDTAFRYPKNSIIYIEGTLKEGWKTSVSINAQQVEQIL